MRRPPSHIVSFDPVGGQGDFIGLQECYRTGKYIVGTPFMASDSGGTENADAMNGVPTMGFEVTVTEL